MKIHPVGAELFSADRWTDRQTNMMKIILTFPSFANMPKNLAPHECSQYLFLHFGSNAVFSDQSNAFYNST
jgi:hypothetical protein